MGIAYPITPAADYRVLPPGQRQCHSNYFGAGLRPGFDCHVACVNEAAAHGPFEAVNRDQCQFMELVFEQQSQLLPLMVLWFRRRP